MYINIKLPPGFGYFNRLQKENFPFNKLFTAYLAEVSRLGLSLSMDVEELVGYIEDKVFDGVRLPDVPEGDEPVNIRYKTEDPDVISYIGGSSLKNRRAVMYIVRMTMRLSVTYGTSLFRLTRLISELGQSAGAVKKPEKPKEQPVPKEVQRPKPATEPKAELETDAENDERPAMPRVSSRASSVVQPVQEPVQTAAVKSAAAARAAVSQLAELTAQVEEPEEEFGSGSDVVQTSEFLKQFGGV